ncbi:hypothetical protein RRG08_054263 [Elysia crispata]|uniref:Uncharacterized protein n=1 Tax=Elysia crispata TaxID=231223 RepID=A0AAE0YBT7_9GAST|nr:hypothetical protein RRG08_054263 [Elysia crispata]
MIPSQMFRAGDKQGRAALNVPGTLLGVRAWCWVSPPLFRIRLWPRSKSLRVPYRVLCYEVPHGAIWSVYDTHGTRDGRNMTEEGVGSAE